MFCHQLIVLAIFSLFKLSSGCDADWVAFGDQCYYFSLTAPETDFTWHQARGFCMYQGGDFASVLAPNETEFLYDQTDGGPFSGHLWIGLNQLQDRQTYRWSDGSAVEYEDWGFDQPLNDGLHQCVYQPTDTTVYCFRRQQDVNVIKNIIYSPYEADYIDTFHFGDYYSNTVDLCEQYCQEEPRCVAYTYFDYYSYPDYTWTGECMGRSARYNVEFPEPFTYSGFRETCGSNPGTWYSDNCGLKKGFICKKDLGSNTPVTVPPTVEVPGYCPMGYFGLDNKCFKMVQGDKDNFSWQQALALCRAEEGVRPDLASFHSAEEAAIITAQLQGATYGYWMGMHKTNGEWVWADNSDVDYTNWGVGEPGDGTDLCVEIWQNIGIPGSWNDNPCDAKRGYVCQTYKDSKNVIDTPQPTSPHSCLPGWTPYWYGCYKMVDELKSWGDANTDCETDGGSLVSIHSESENSAVFVFSVDSTPVWIGLTQSPDLEYRWTDGWPVVYTRWGANEPGNGEGCVMMNRYGLWDDVGCRDEYKSICKATDVLPPTTPPPNSGVCPDSQWTGFGDYCYYYSDYNTAYDWNDAQLQCNQMTASNPNYVSNLVSIHSHVENQFLFETLKSDASYYDIYIGLRKDDRDSDHYWVDGSPVQYTFWAPGMPDDTDGTQLCVSMYHQLWSGHWFDHNCYDSYRSYFCKTAKFGGNTASPHTTLSPGPTTTGGGNCFRREPNINVINTLLGNPSEADGVDTFQFGNYMDNNVDLCEQYCQEEPRCVAYTYFHFDHPGGVWYGECMGRSDLYNVQDPEDSTDAGFRESCGEKEVFLTGKINGTDSPAKTTTKPTSMTTKTPKPKPTSTLQKPQTTPSGGLSRTNLIITIVVPMGVVILALTVAAIILARKLRLSQPFENLTGNA